MIFFGDKMPLLNVAEELLLSDWSLLHLVLGIACGPERRKAWRVGSRGNYFSGQVGVGVTILLDELEQGWLS